MSRVKLTGYWFGYEKNPAVYENKYGERIHTFGLIRNKNDVSERVPEDLLIKFLRLTGWNRRRSLMAYVEQKGKTP